MKMPWTILKELNKEIEKLNEEREKLNGEIKELKKEKQEIEKKKLERQKQINEEIEEIEKKKRNRLYNKIDDEKNKIHEKLRNFEIEERIKIAKKINVRNILHRNRLDIDLANLDSKQTQYNIDNNKLIEDRAAFETQKNTDKQEIESKREEMLQKLEKKKKEFEAEKKLEEEELKKEKEKFEAEKTLEEEKLKKKKEEFEEEINKERKNIEDKIQAGISEETKQIKKDNEKLNKENNKLLENIRLNEQSIREYNAFKAKFKDDDGNVLSPDFVMNENLRLKTELDEANKELGEYKLDKELFCERYNTDEAIIKDLRDEIGKNKTEIENYKDFKEKEKKYEEQINNLMIEKKGLEGEISKQQICLDRLENLLKGYEEKLGIISDEKQEQLKKEIENYKYIEENIITEENKEKRKYNENEQADEIEWLNKIWESCKNYGIDIPKRILYSFHTSLKISEWSPLTILAGVSGTGKSELPKLYSYFGGLYFLSAAVQPNWDSQESMLGFFNSIDHKFDAQDILKFLVQSQNDDLKDKLCIILLDELNLAHPELYFAEFLSVLETRRGRADSDVPKLNVKIGTGLEPYQIPLGRNVLWTGTMNQDETTKTLSDKVLDRSMIINFPSPKELKSRKGNVELSYSDRRYIVDKDGTKGKNVKILTTNIWKNWQEYKYDDSFEEDFDKYREYIEKVNEKLSVIGRAIGHRVWQSVEHYMKQYPTVRYYIEHSEDNKEKLNNALKDAFEDQVVQKVMPKLRGIDTSGDSKKTLEQIQKYLCEEDQGPKLKDISPDFNNAMKFGDGYFVWKTADYISKSYNSANGEQNN